MSLRGAGVARMARCSWIWNAISRELSSKGAPLELLTTWLQAHPTVAILVRDRADAYALAGRQAAPHVLQVADRFHLVRNVGEALKTLLHSTGPAADCRLRKRRQKSYLASIGRRIRSNPPGFIKSAGEFPGAVILFGAAILFGACVLCLVFFTRKLHRKHSLPPVDRTSPDYYWSPGQHGDYFDKPHD